MSWWPIKIVVRKVELPARSPEQHIERMRNLIAFTLVGSFIGALIDFTLFPVPAGNKDIVTYMVGQLSGMALMALGFYFTNKIGADAVEAKRVELDAKRADNTGKLADAVVAAAAAGGAVVPTVTKAFEDMTLDELVAAATKDASIILPDPMDEGVLRLALIAKRDGS